MRKKLAVTIIMCLFLLAGCGSQAGEGTETKQTPLPPNLVLEETIAPTQETTEPQKGTPEQGTEETDEPVNDENSGALESDRTEQDLLAYKSILDLYYQALYEREHDPDNWDSQKWYLDRDLVMSVIYTLWRSNDEPFSMDMEGFTFMDLNKDGTDELMIGALGSDFMDNTRGYVLAVYCLKDGAPVLAVEGWERNRYIIGNDGYIYNFGSNGAAYSVCTKYVFDTDADGYRKMVERYYTFEEGNGIEARHVTDPEDTEIGFTGEHNGEAATNEEYRDARSEWAQLGIRIDYTPFSQYQYTE